MFSGRSTMAVCKAGGLVNRVRVPAPRLSVKFICRQVPPVREYQKPESNLWFLIKRKVDALVPLHPPAP